MTDHPTRKWFLLIHQIPPKPNAFRVKIWRRLQQVGAVPIKPSVYALPFSQEAKEDFSWILKEVLDRGGDGAILETRFVEGLSDEQVIGLFQKARKADYEKIILEARSLIALLETQPHDGKLPPKEAGALSRLSSRFKEVAALDFFNAPEQGTADILLKDLARLERGGSLPVQGQALDRLKGKTWITRSNIFVDRMACGWLIRRFVDPEARFSFLAEPPQTPVKNSLRFDMHSGEYTHEGDKCSFEVMAEKLGIQDRAVAVMAQMVHDIDLKEEKFGHPETPGVRAMLTGITAAETDDQARMTQGIDLFEHLYAYIHRNMK